VADSIEHQPETAATSEGVVSLADALAKLTTLLPGLADALDRQSKSNPPVTRMTLRLDEVAEAVGVSRRVLERERSAGRMPKPDLRIGKMPLWRVETIQAWIGSGGKGVV
jgi:predicted DNA-binding transcriptional regulator AlpA